MVTSLSFKKQFFIFLKSTKSVLRKMFKFSKKDILFYSLVFFIVLLDQLSKLFFKKLGNLEVLPFFSFHLMENTGAGFGILKEQTGLLSIISISMIFIVLYLKLLYSKKDRLINYSLILVLGGTIGNLIDRLFRGKILDFLYFHFPWFSYPAFNVADIAIFCGSIILIIQVLRKKID